MYLLYYFACFACLEFTSGSTRAPISSPGFRFQVILAPIKFQRNFIRFVQLFHSPMSTPMDLLAGSGSVRLGRWQHRVPEGFDAEYYKRQRRRHEGVPTGTHQPANVRD